MNNSIHFKAYAKINLGLDVVGKRADGYHEVRMIMQNIKLYDKISIHIINSSKIKLQTNLPYLPSNDNNIVYKAASLLREKHNIKSGLYINLNKTIPVSAGLAGGSTDAAATLHGMNELFNLNLTLDELMDVGLILGADVPYCLMGGTVLSEGIGEKLTKLPPLPFCHILIVKPKINVSTQKIYQNFDLLKVTNHPNIDAIIQGIENNDLHQTTKYLGNVLESVTINKYPEIEKIKNTMIEQGAINSLMSGSGPTVFGIFDDSKKAKNAYYYFKVLNFEYQVFLSKPIKKTN